MAERLDWARRLEQVERLKAEERMKNPKENFPGGEAGITPRMREKRLRSEWLTQEQIGERIGWSRKQVSDYVRLLDNVAPEVSGLARAHRDGRGAENAPNGAMFTEGWFRNSGIYELQPEYQRRLMEWFIEEQKCKPAPKMVQKF